MAQRRQFPRDARPGQPISGRVQFGETLDDVIAPWGALGSDRHKSLIEKYIPVDRYRIPILIHGFSG